MVRCAGATTTAGVSSSGTAIGAQAEDGAAAIFIAAAATHAERSGARPLHGMARARSVARDILMFRSLGRRAKDTRIITPCTGQGTTPRIGEGTKHSRQAFYF